MLRFLPLALLLACVPDDDVDGNDRDLLGGQGGEDDTGASSDGTGDGTGDDGSGQTGLTGDWLSAGADLSPLFQNESFDYSRVDATFKSDGSYVVEVLTNGGDIYELIGTYTANSSSDPGTIELVQDSPYEATAKGIYAVDGDTLTYEVVQTNPASGCTPPTPTSGFGATDCGGSIGAGDNIQIYRRQ